jgi:aryl-alcohol dehydrogenase-like predicted oxidoreductase
MMEYRRLGTTDLLVSRICLGCMMMGWRCDLSEARRIFEVAKAFGVNFIDTSVSYGRGKSHKIIGTCVPRSERNSWLIATKVGGISSDSDPIDNHGLHPKNIIRQCELSLRQLEVDHIDLLQLHMPYDEVPVVEQLGALDLLRERGLVRHYGVCNYDLQRFASLIETADKEGLFRPASHQFSYNYLEAEGRADKISQCLKFDVSPLVWGPLASGLLTDRYQVRRTPLSNTRISSGRECEVRTKQLASSEVGEKLDSLRGLASSNGSTMQAEAIRWLTDQSKIDSVIVGPTTASQLFELIQSQ